ncbi:hypothetical protein [Marinobacterium stanieri]|uniref:hypothetical protein n=1 Tax=Marinobacterium stanieri TaxID=49186 RepID=UPI001C37633D|nr:hypothetical protein [Marinobacterium stanieri]
MNSKSKWLIYTVLVGLIPMFSRFLIWVVTTPGTVNIISSSDFIAFGLILHISNINEIEHFDSKDRDWKTRHNGFSIVFIAIYTVLFSLTMLSEGVSSINTSYIERCAIALSMVSFLLSFIVFDRITKLSSKEVA